MVFINICPIDCGLAELEDICGMHKINSSDQLTKPWEYQIGVIFQPNLKTQVTSKITWRTPPIGETATADRQEQYIKYGGQDLRVTL